MPEVGSTIKFNNIHKQLKAPFVIYADFECITEHIDDKDVGCSEYQKHIPSSFCFNIVSDFANFKPVLYRGPNAVNHFLDELFKAEEEILKIVNVNCPMKMTPSDWKRHKNNNVCHICQKPIVSKKCRDHCHITGKYRGPAHSECNLQFNYKYYKIPIFIHNSKGYDTHLIMQQIAKYNDKKIECIPKTEEQYITFSIGKLQFLDSLAFMNSSLSKLVDNLANINKDAGKLEPEIEKFKITMKYFFEKVRDNELIYENGECIPITESKQNKNDFKICIKDHHEIVNNAKFKLVIRKGVYPYDYMNSFDKFDEQSLPPIDAFYSKLTNEGIEENEYKHAQTVWQQFNIKNMGEYNDLYLLTDVLLLADVFESFRNTCIRHYQLDPANYITLPGLAWDAALKMSCITLDLFNNQQLDMYLKVEKHIRGGISMISHKYSKANNKYMKDHDTSTQSKYITYVDANNLYGWSMCQPLPVNDYKYENISNYSVEDILKLDDNGDRGYFFEVDLEYPKELHNSHNDYPLAPEKKLVTKEMMSVKTRSIMNYNNDKEYKKRVFPIDISKGDKVEKLICDLTDKNKYGIHYRTLKLYLTLGMKLKKIHSCISFHQTPWLREYINYNSGERAKSKNEFEKDFFKLMNNAVFGKTMENVRNRISMILINNDKDKLNKYTSKPNYKRYTIFTENEKQIESDLCAVHMRKQTVELNKPIAVGQAILDLSKLHMYDFYYNVLKKDYGDNMKLLFTDTDSLCYEVMTDDLFKDMYEKKQYYDLSDFPKDHFLYDPSNKKVAGKFKEEFNSSIINEFVGLRAKSYSILFDSQKEKKVCKGVNKCVIKKCLTHDEYKKCLFENSIRKDTMNNIRSKQHNIYSTETNKISLSSCDNKRYVLDDGITTYAHGHYLIK